MEKVMSVVENLSSKFATESNEKQEVRQRATELEDVFEEKFGGVPSLYTFCNETNISTEALEGDIDLDAEDFGAAIFCDVVGFPCGAGEMQHEVACRKLDLNVEPRHFRVLQDCYYKLL